MSNNFCIKPFDTLWINPEGTVCVCCKNPVKISDPSGKNYNVSSDKLSTIWMSDHMKTLRKKFINGEKPDECKQCWDEEDTGIQSLRKGTTQTFFESNPDIDRDLLIKSQEDSPVIRELNLTLTNKCNLACRICGPYLSSLWQTQHEKLNIPLLPADYFETVSLDKFDDNRRQALHTMSTHLRNVLIYGGEPLINDEVLDYLKFLVDSDLAKNIDLTMNTNGTVYNEDLIKVFSNFHRVNLFLSIDDIGTRFEYQRWPAKWSKIEQNLIKYSSLSAPFHVGIYPTTSLLNIVTLEETLDELNKYGIPMMFNNLIHEPEILCLKNLPDDLKAEVIKIVEKIDFTKYNFFNPDSGHKEFIINFINLPRDRGHEYGDKEYYRKDLEHFLSVHDTNRKTYMKDYLPKLNEMLYGN